MKLYSRSIIYLSLIVLISISCSSKIGVTEPSTYPTTQMHKIVKPSQIKPILLTSSESLRLQSVVGQKHVIQIVSNPSTGYRWEMSSEESAKKCIDVLSEQMIYDEKDTLDGLRRPGSPGKQEWLLQTNCFGNYKVIFVYKRSWENQLPVSQATLEFVTIKE